MLAVAFPGCSFHLISMFDFSRLSELVEFFFILSTDWVIGFLGSMGGMYFARGQFWVRQLSLTIHVVQEKLFFFRYDDETLYVIK